MNREEIKLMFKRIQMIYPQFQVSTDIINLWTKLFGGADIDKVAYKLDKYLLENEYPPKPADLFVKKQEKDVEIEKIKELEKQVKLEGPIPKQQKEKMDKALEKLMIKVSKNV